MDDLAAWLTQIWNEDEALARAAQHPDGEYTLNWRPGGKRRVRFDNGGQEHLTSVFAGDWDRIWVLRDGAAGGSLAPHIARHDPATVLARIDADRQILALHKPTQVQVLRTVVDGQWIKETASGCQYCAELCHSRSGLGCADDGLDAPWPCETIRILASPHSSRPGYLEKWRPA